MWNYYNPVDIIFGENKFLEIHKILENKKYILVTHPEEIFKKYTDQLNKSSNPPLIVMTDVKPNPDYLDILKLSKNFSSIAKEVDLILFLFPADQGQKVFDSFDETIEPLKKLNHINLLTKVDLKNTLELSKGEGFLPISCHNHTNLDVLVDKISKISVEMKKLLTDNIYLDSILKNGCEKAEKIANKNIRDLKSLIGFLRGSLYDSN